MCFCERNLNIYSSIPICGRMLNCSHRTHETLTKLIICSGSWKALLENICEVTARTGEDWIWWWKINMIQKTSIAVSCFCGSRLKFAKVSCDSTKDEYIAFRISPALRIYWTSAVCDRNERFRFILLFFSKSTSNRTTGHTVVELLLDIWGTPRKSAFAQFLPVPLKKFAVLNCLNLSYL